jgi:hypothetical protein
MTQVEFLEIVRAIIAFAGLLGVLSLMFFVINYFTKKEREELRTLRKEMIIFFKTQNRPIIEIFRSFEEFSKDEEKGGGENVDN